MTRRSRREEEGRSAAAAGKGGEGECAGEGCSGAAVQWRGQRRSDDAAALPLSLSPAVSAAAHLWTEASPLSSDITVDLCPPPCSRHLHRTSHHRTISSTAGRRPLAHDSTRHPILPPANTNSTVQSRHYESTSSPVSPVTTTASPSLLLSAHTDHHPHYHTPAQLRSTVLSHFRLYRGAQQRHSASLLQCSHSPSCEKALRLPPFTVALPLSPPRPSVVDDGVLEVYAASLVRCVPRVVGRQGRQHPDPPAG